MENNNISNATILRKKAEENLKKKAAKINLPHSEADVLRLIHELEVHQIELELQNDELMLAKEREAAAASGKYNELYDFAPLGYFTLTNEGEIKELNLCASQMLGKDRLHLKNSNFGFFVSNDNKPTFNLFLEKVLNSKTRETCELILSANGNQSMQVFLTGIAAENGGQCHVSAIDITRLKQAEEEIRRNHESIQLLNRHLIEIREEERILISRELHDQLGQSLTALKFDINRLHDKIAIDSEEGAKLNRMSELISSIIADVQQIVFEMRPPIIDDIGLAAAIEWYSEEFAIRTGLQVEMELDEVQTLDIYKDLAIYRVHQESLTNIARHAGAKNVHIKLCKIEKNIVLLIKDDGIGISPEKIVSPKSIGLIGMSERVKQIGGQMEITTPLIGGTNIVVYIPV